MGLVARRIENLDWLRSRIVGFRQDLLPVIAKRIAAGYVKLVADEFRDSHDPYGVPWKPVVRNRRRDRRARERRAAKGLVARADKPLVDTGRLRASVTARVDGSVVRVALPVEYASYHQYGTRRIARRQILPEADTGGLPAAWVEMAINEANKTLAEYFRKGR
jgi:phage gpG-like protein